MKKLWMPALALAVLPGLGYAEEVAAVTNAPVAVKAQETCPVSFWLTLDLYSAYVWRGCVNTAEPVWQPDVGMGYDLKEYGKLLVDVWGNFDATRINGRSHFAGLNEMDYTTQYAVDVKDFSLSFGHIWYNFPQANGPDYYPDTREIFTTLAYNNGLIVPFVKAYYDYVSADGLYGLAGLRKEVSVADRTTLGSEVDVAFGSQSYNEYYFGNGGESGVLHGDAAIYAKYALTDNLSIGARIAWMSLMDNNIKGAYAHDNMLWGGINLGATF